MKHAERLRRLEAVVQVQREPRTLDEYFTFLDAGLEPEGPVADIMSRFFEKCRLEKCRLRAEAESTGEGEGR